MRSVICSEILNVGLNNPYIIKVVKDTYPLSPVLKAEP